MIKKFLGILTGLFLIVGMSAAQDVANEPLAYINYLEGSGGRIVSQDSLEEAEINMLILQGDELRSQYCWMEIWTRTGYIRLDHNAVVEFTILEEESTMLTIWRGNVYIRAKNRIGIKTFNKSFNLEPGLYRIEVTDKTKVYKNPILIDDFDRWNEKREKEIRRSTDQRYLPEELNDYEYTLYNYGSWRYDAIYGYVWIPRVDDGWRPYFYGRWVWYPIIGWTWVSYEPFGWSVYHYGRWQWDVGFGWYWIPTRIWGPSWVYFHSYGDYYFWTPRWYDDHYYQRHRDRYTNIRSNVWTTVHKNQLSSKNIAKSAISKSELTKAPRISQNQLRTSPASTSSASLQLQSSSIKTISRSPRNTYSQSPAPTRKIYSPDSKISIQRKNPEPINFRNSRITNLSARNSLSPPRSYSSPRTSTLSPFRPSPSRSFSRPSSFSRSRPSIQSRTIRKKR